ncbi:DMT family transporter [Lachnobacterium bovis]|uniref:Permease of the drug/metabolite transporter (DMT) superfamily n=1 Tax=Lachnobacterium bovis DSM 14045 TaxID=1122142 RepID=A0A1H3L269_9FIRM|nr:EamA family transporter [Lachnobacterium bovis]SDY58501.1 Permease of the drug/metabolite transporter (DMT) superfamily [Lachnobacterium bovis DSM 14045]
MNKLYLKGVLLTVLGASCWGLSGSMGQYLFTVQKMDSRWLVPIRLGLAGVILLVYSFIKNRKEVMLPWANLKSSIIMLLYGLIGVSFCQFFYFLTIELSSAAVGTILQDLAPVFILIFTCVIGKRFPKVTEIGSIAMALIGVFLITTHGNIKTMSISSMALITGIISGICVAIYNILAPKLSHIKVIIIQGWSFLLGGVLGALIFKIWEIKYVPNLYGLFGIVFVIVVGNVLAFNLYISGVQKIGPDKASLYSFAEPITATVISTTMLHSKFTLYDVAGFIMIFAMLWLITLDAKKEKSIQK